MKQIIPAVLLFLTSSAEAQNKIVPQPCQDDNDAAHQPAIYFDHTRPKYPFNITEYNATDKAAIMKQLTAIEKLEEGSRANFKATGCVLRTSFSATSKTSFGGYTHASYGYQLGAYQLVCHVTEHVANEVGEYRTVFRVNVNPSLDQWHAYGEHYDFYLTDRSVRYDVSIRGITKAGNVDRNTITRISQVVSQNQVTNDPKEFDKINNGTGYLESTMGGSNPKVYLWLDRKYYITKQGVPLLVPLTRKEYLEALLEYYEIEKKNFQTEMGYKINDDSRSTSPEAKKRMTIYEADKIAYQQIYEGKKAKVQNILSTQKSEWLQKQAVVANRQPGANNYAEPANGLFEFNQFANTGELLYQFNPAYFKENVATPVKPVFFLVQFRYEMGRYFSETLFNNFLKNYDFSALYKMLQ